MWLAMSQASLVQSKCRCHGHDHQGGGGGTGRRTCSVVDAADSGCSDERSNDTRGALVRRVCQVPSDLKDATARLRCTWHKSQGGCARDAGLTHAVKCITLLASNGGTCVVSNGSDVHGRNAAVRDWVDAAVLQHGLAVTCANTWCSSVAQPQPRGFTESNTGSASL